MSYLISVLNLTLGMCIAYHAAEMEPRGPWDHRKRIGYIIASVICTSAFISITTGAA
jgi:hypothetical protein|nr:MAG TPA: hypothetical protein [Bacteriophage sp.]